MRRRDHVLLLTGQPGVGKTTIVRAVAAALTDKRIAGFYTAEIRVRGDRRGFRAVTFDGRIAVIAAVDLKSTHRVGKYGVDVAAMDAVADSLAPAVEADVVLVDEIGKMECLSSRFVRAMRARLEAAAPVVATVAQRGGGFIAEVKDRADAELWHVTRATRDDLPARVLDWLDAQR
jgi:nucleoside-triphosphatase